MAEIQNGRRRNSLMFNIRLRILVLMSYLMFFFLEYISIETYFIYFRWYFTRFPLNSRGIYLIMVIYEDLLQMY